MVMLMDKDIKVGDRVEFVGGGPIMPNNGERGVVVAVRGPGTGDPYHVSFDSFQGGEPWWCSSVQKVSDSLEQKVVEYLTMPERSNSNEIFRWLGEQGFFGAQHDAQQTIMDRLFNSTLVCNNGVQRFRDFAGEVLRKPTSKKTFEITLRMEVEHDHTSFGRDPSMDCGMVGAVMKALQDADPLPVTQGEAVITNLRWFEYKVSDIED